MTVASFRVRLTMPCNPGIAGIAPRALSRSKNPIDRLLVPRASQPHADHRFFLLGSRDCELNPYVQFSAGITHEISSIVSGRDPNFGRCAREANCHFTRMNHPPTIHSREVQMGFRSPILCLLLCWYRAEISFQVDRDFGALGLLST
jgi:hypothetical protein